MPPLFSYGFRPFFLGAGLIALVVVPLWSLSLATGLALPLAWPPMTVTRISVMSMAASVA